MKKISIKQFAIVLGLMLAFATAQAQQTSTLRGQVMDEQGAVIPGAKITVTNKATNKQ